MNDHYFNIIVTSLFAIFLAIIATFLVLKCSEVATPRCIVTDLDAARIMKLQLKICALEKDIPIQLYTNTSDTRARLNALWALSRSIYALPDHLAERLDTLELRVIERETQLTKKSNCCVIL